MKPEELDEWWASLTVSQKERIAGKYVSKHAGVEMTCYYPNCSNLWNSLSQTDKKWLHDHCTDAHGYLKQEYKEGQTMSY